MPTLSGLYRATWSGLIGTEEIFAYNRYVWAPALTISPDDVLGALSGSVTDMLGQTVTGSVSIATLAELFPAHVSWTKLKVTPIEQSTGLLTTGLSSTEMVLTDVGAGTSADGLPYQNAIAVTTRSAGRGPKTRNRFYLPTPVWRALDGHGDLQAPVANAIVLWMTLGSTALNDTLDGSDGGFVNYSPADHAAKPQVDVYLGSRIDTVSRRRNHAPETRYIDALVSVGP